MERETERRGKVCICYIVGLSEGQKEDRAGCLDLFGQRDREEHRKRLPIGAPSKGPRSKGAKIERKKRPRRKANKKARKKAAKTDHDAAESSSDDLPLYARAPNPLEVFWDSCSAE